MPVFICISILVIVIVQKQRINAGLSLKNILFFKFFLLQTFDFTKKLHIFVGEIRL